MKSLKSYIVKESALAAGLLTTAACFSIPLLPILGFCIIPGVKDIIDEKFFDRYVRPFQAFFKKYPILREPIKRTITKYSEEIRDTLWTDPDVYKPTWKEKREQKKINKKEAESLFNKCLSELENLIYKVGGEEALSQWGELKNLIEKNSDKIFNKLSRVDGSVIWGYLR